MAKEHKDYYIVVNQEMLDAGDRRECVVAICEELDDAERHAGYGDGFVIYSPA